MKAEVTNLFKQVETAIDTNDSPGLLTRAGVIALARIRAHIEEQAGEVERQYQIGVETACLADKLERDLATIRSALSAVLGVEGEAVELAGLAGKVIPELADCPEDVCHACIGRELGCDVYASPDGLCSERRIKAAIDAAKGEAH